jgi:hypothetical protein
MSKTEMTVAPGGLPQGATRMQVRKLRSDGWTAAKKKKFIAMLAETANVRMAVKAVGMSGFSAYSLRKKSPAFAKAWAEALEIGVAQLEMMVLEKALNGEEKPVYYAGKVIGTAPAYSERLAIFLLKAHKPEVYGSTPLTARYQKAPTPEPVVDAEEARARMLALLDQVSERLDDGA